MQHLNLPDSNPDGSSKEQEYRAKQLHNWAFHNSSPNLTINKLIIKVLGLNAAVLLEDLLLKEQNFCEKKELDEDGYFYDTEISRVDSLRLSVYEQSKVIKELEKLGILFPVLFKGIPARQRFKFNHNHLYDFYQNIDPSNQDSKNLKDSGPKNLEPCLQNFKVYSTTVSTTISKRKRRERESERESAFNNEKKKTLLKERKTKESPNHIESKTGEYAVIQVWNKLPPPARIHTKLNTKTIRQTLQCLTQMRVGIFGDPSRRNWDVQWLNKHQIDQQLFSEKKWTIREICRTIEGPLADMYKDGYWPQNKDKLPKSLVDAFYNPRNRNSFFMLAYYDPPGLIQGRIKDPHPGITKYLIDLGLINLKQMKAGDWKQYGQEIRILEKYLKEEIDWSNYGARQMFPGGQNGNPYTLIVEYVKWMMGENADLLSPSRVPERLHLAMIKPDYWLFQKFMEAINRYWGRMFKSIKAEED